MDRDRGNSPMRYNDYHAGGNRGRDDYERRENRGSRTYNSPFTNRGRSLGGNTYGSRDRVSHGGRNRYGSEKGLLRSDSFNRHGGNSYNDRMGSLRADQVILFSVNYFKFAFLLWLFFKIAPHYLFSILLFQNRGHSITITMTGPAVM